MLGDVGSHATVLRLCLSVQKVLGYSKLLPSYSQECSPVTLQLLSSYSQVAPKLLLSYSQVTYSLVTLKLLSSNSASAPASASKLLGLLFNCCQKRYSQLKYSQVTLWLLSSHSQVTLKQLSVSPSISLPVTCPIVQLLSVISANAALQRMKLMTLFVGCDLDSACLQSRLQVL